MYFSSWEDIFTVFYVSDNKAILDVHAVDLPLVCEAVEVGNSPGTEKTGGGRGRNIFNQGLFKHFERHHKINRELYCLDFIRSYHSRFCASQN